MYLVAPREKLNVFPESLDLPVIISRYTKYSKYTHSRHLRSQKHFKFTRTLRSRISAHHIFSKIIYQRYFLGTLFTLLRKSFNGWEHARIFFEFVTYHNHFDRQT